MRATHTCHGELFRANDGSSLLERPAVTQGRFAARAFRSRAGTSCDLPRTTALRSRTPTPGKGAPSGVEVLAHRGPVSGTVYPRPPPQRPSEALGWARGAAGTLRSDFIRVTSTTLLGGGASQVSRPHTSTGASPQALFAGVNPRADTPRGAGRCRRAASCPCGGSRLNAAHAPSRLGGTCSERQHRPSDSLGPILSAQQGADGVAPGLSAP